MVAETPRGAASLAARLIGTWELRSREDHTAGGTRRIDPALGPDPLGILMYDRSGHFAAQFMKRERDGAPAAIAVGAIDPNNSRARDGYDAYFGVYSVHEPSGTVTQRLVGALSADNVGQTLTRAMAVEGDELTIHLDTVTIDGEPITRVLRWQRVG
jgi:hypothetical protein